MKTNIILQGDCIEEMKKLPENSVDAIITDPPYGLEFMGKEWDKFDKEKGSWDKRGNEGKTKDSYGRLQGTTPIKYQAGKPLQEFCFKWASACLRILKPGGFLLSFGGTRTYHRLVCGIEDAGFEIRDTIMWLYASGFPKSYNVGKAIDKIQGNERNKIGEGKGKSYVHQNKINVEQGFRPKDYYKDNGGEFEITKGNSEWEGWGTALKPAVEPIVVARKPLSEKNVALNVLKWGTGGINIDDCRIETNPKVDDMKREVYRGERDKESDWAKNSGFKNETNKYTGVPIEGRFPANIILDEEAGKMLDEQTGDLKSGSGAIKKATAKGYQGNDYGVESRPIGTEMISHNDKGGASRFFYCAKSSKSERNLGCDKLDEKNIDYEGRKGQNNSIERPDGSIRKENISKNNHPTVKPIKLMEYLIKLVSKKGATILDPFLGSGTTAIACLKQKRKFIGIEKEEEYIKIAKARIKPFKEQSDINSFNGKSK